MNCETFLDARRVAQQAGRSRQGRLNSPATIAATPTAGEDDIAVCNVSPSLRRGSQSRSCTHTLKLITIFCYCLCRHKEYYPHSTISVSCAPDLYSSSNRVRYARENRAIVLTRVGYGIVALHQMGTLHRASAAPPGRESGSR
jgi:hypothetical protein